MKKALTLALTLVMLVSVALPALAADTVLDVDVAVNGERLEWTDAVPFIDENGRTLVPLRAVGDALGLEVEWNPETREAIFSREYTLEDCIGYQEGDEYYTSKREIRFPIGSEIAQFNYVDTYLKEGAEPVSGSFQIEMDTAAIIKDGRSFAPVRYLAEQFGYSVDWNSATRTVLLAPGLTYILHQEYFEATEGKLGVYYYPGERFEEYGNIELVSAMVNGLDAEIRVFTEAELEEFSKTHENTVYAFYIVADWADFSDSGTNYQLEWVYQLTKADGESYTQTRISLFNASILP